MDPPGWWFEFDVASRFWAAVVKTSRGCWLWRGGKYGDNYGTFSLTSRQKVATHRYSWMLHNGPVPDGLLVCHHCDVRPCVNPAHLFLGTPKDNAVDFRRKPHAAHARKLTPEQAAEIRAERAKGTTCAALAKRYGVSVATISLVGRGERWGWLR